MEPDLQSTIALLAAKPAALNALLRDLPDELTLANEGSTHDGSPTWCPQEIVAHLIYGERADWIPRLRMILEHGEAKTFAPFDREGFARELQEMRAKTRDEASRGPEGHSLAELLDEFARVRAANLKELRAMKLGKKDLARRGRHPVFGSVTLGQLLATWPAHDLTHLHQLARVLAHQYRNAVGPWTEYLGVMQCDAHSARA
jgi:hypothetical protein